MESIRLTTGSLTPIDIALAMKASNVLPVVGGLIALVNRIYSAIDLKRTNKRLSHPTIPRPQCWGSLQWNQIARSYEPLSIITAYRAQLYSRIWSLVMLIENCTPAWKDESNPAGVPAVSFAARGVHGSSNED